MMTSVHLHYITHTHTHTILMAIYQVRGERGLA